MAEFMSTEQPSSYSIKNIEREDYKTRAARLISNMVSPPMVFAVLGFVLAWSSLPAWQGLVWGAVYGFFISLVPLIVVIVMYRKGHVQDLHMSDTRQRRVPYLVSVGGAALVYALVNWFNGPAILGVLAICNVIGLGVLGVINNFWLISNHMASVTSAVLFMGMEFDLMVGLLLTPLIILVFYARRILQRHTPAQLYAGTLVGLGSVWILTCAGLL